MIILQTMVGFHHRGTAGLTFWEKCRLALGGQIGERELLRAAELPETLMMQCSFGYLCASMTVRQAYQLLPTMILAKNNRHDTVRV